MEVRPPGSALVGERLAARRSEIPRDGRIHPERGFIHAPLSQRRNEARTSVSALDGKSPVACRPQIAINNQSHGTIEARPSGSALVGKHLAAYCSEIPRDGGIHSKRS